MVQRIFGLGLGGTGIVAVLIIAGIILIKLDILPSAGTTSISGGVFIGIILGVLGIVGVLNRLI